MPPKAAAAAGAHGLTANDVNMLVFAAKCGANFTENVDWEKFAQMGGQKYVRNAKSALKKVVDKLSGMNDDGDDAGDADASEGQPMPAAAKGKKAAGAKTGSPTKKAVSARKTPVKANAGMEEKGAKNGTRSKRAKVEPKKEEGVKLEPKQEEDDKSGVMADDEEDGKSTYLDRDPYYDSDDNGPDRIDMELARARGMEYEEYIRVREERGGYMTPPTPGPANLSDEDA